MTSENALTIFPQKKIRPYDGMPVTADIWDQSHAYHEQVQRSHNLFFHGSGILAGLEVIASDPPDHLVYILPGVAVDPNGQVIVLSEPVAYDIGGDVDGLLYLFISHRKSISPHSETNPELEPEYTQDQFLISARPSIPDQPVVELARFKRDSRTAPIRDARDLLHPVVNEIDNRYRNEVPLQRDALLTAAIVYLGSVKDKVQGLALSRISGELQRTAHIRLVIDDDHALDPDVLSYHLIYLVGEGSFQPTSAQVKGLQGYLERGGTLFIESCDETSATAFADLCQQFGITLQPVTSGVSLLDHPFVFSSPPAGYYSGEITSGEGVIFSRVAYGRLWAGAKQDGPLSREENRAAIEWCANLLSSALERSRST